MQSWCAFGLIFGFSASSKRFESIGSGPSMNELSGSFGFSNRHCDRVFVNIKVNISGKIVHHRSPFLAAQLYATASENGHLIYLFLGSEAGGKSAAIAYTLIETAKMNKASPEAWLAWGPGQNASKIIPQTVSTTSYRGPIRI